jgi:hypothetical protein
MSNTETRDTFEMTFTTSLGGQKIVRINDPHSENIDDSFAEGMGDAFTQINLFEPAIGRLDRLIGAAIITETITTLI